MARLRAPKLNPLAMARRDPMLTRCVIPKPGNLFVSVDLCYPEKDTEFLTREGWKRFDDIKPTDEIWQVNPKTLIGSWVLPKRRIKYEYNGKMISYPSVRGSLTVTEGHRMLWVGQQSHKRKDKADWRNITYASEREKLNKIQHFAHFSKNQEVSKYSESEIWIACMLHADGSLDRGRDKFYRIQVNKERKKQKIKYLLGREGSDSSRIRDTHTQLSTTWNSIKFNSRLLKGKTFELDSLGFNQVDIFVEALVFWDGHASVKGARTGRVSWSSSVIQEAEKVQAFLVRNGYEARLQTGRDPKGKPHYSLSIKKLGCTRFSLSEQVAPSGAVTKSKKIVTTATNTTVVCFEVDDGFLLVRQNGQTFVGSNCAAEPVVVANFSKDSRYYDAVFGMKGKTPRWNGRFLEIDDLYLTVASGCKSSGPDLKKLWNQGIFSKWLTNRDEVAGKVKKIRSPNKTKTLGLLYGMGAKTMTNNLIDQGYPALLEDSKKFHKMFWRELFTDIDRFRKLKAQQFRKQGRIINPFGYRLNPSSPHKAFNYFIQSTVSGLIHMICGKLFYKCDWLDFFGVIHDEVIFECPVGRLDDAKERIRKVQESLNNDLKWDIQMELGFCYGRDLYAAKDNDPDIPKFNRWLNKKHNEGRISSKGFEKYTDKLYISHSK